MFEKKMWKTATEMYRNYLRVLHFWRPENRVYLCIIWPNEMELTFLVGNYQILNVDAQNICANWVRRGWEFRNRFDAVGGGIRIPVSSAQLIHFSCSCSCFCCYCFCNALSYWLIKLFTLCVRDNNNENNKKRNVSKLYIVAYMF